MDAREIRMEVVSHEEALEYCETHGIEFEETYIEDGKLMMLGCIKGVADDIEYEKHLDTLYNKTIKDTYICTSTIHGTMYLADMKKCAMGTTFKRELAQKFTWATASKRVVFMNRSGAYNWEARREK